MVTPDAERTMNTALAISADLSPANVEPEILDGADYLYIEGYLATSETGRAAAIAMREAAQARGVKVAMSLSDPGIVEFFEPQLREMAGGKLDLVFCNEAEALKWTGTNQLAQAAEALAHDSRCYAITRGAQGALCFDGANQISVSAPQVQALDTNGAGDMFAGAFLAALNADKNYQEAAVFACRCASQVVTRMGPRLDTNGYAELRKFF